jgi:hypothetical protein
MAKAAGRSVSWPSVPRPLASAANALHTLGRVARFPVWLTRRASVARLPGAVLNGAKRSSAAANAAWTSAAAPSEGARTTVATEAASPLWRAQGARP